MTVIIETTAEQRAKAANLGMMFPIILPTLLDQAAQNGMDGPVNAVIGQLEKIGVTEADFIAIVQALSGAREIRLTADDKLVIRVCPAD